MKAQAIREHKEVKGDSITECHTINSQYADGKVRVLTQDGEEFRIDVSELVKLFRGKAFNATLKRTYYHLKLA